jgi:hypothetical protein
VPASALSRVSRQDWEGHPSVIVFTSVHLYQIRYYSRWLQVLYDLLTVNIGICMVLRTRAASIEYPSEKNEAIALANNRISGWPSHPPGLETAAGDLGFRLGGREYYAGDVRQVNVLVGITLPYLLTQFPSKSTLLFFFLPLSYTSHIAYWRILKRVIRPNTIV